MNGNELLALLAPPLDLVIWLDKIFAAKRAKGEVVPEEYTQWLTVWQNIRLDGASEIDNLPGATWQQASAAVQQAQKELAF